MTWQSCESCNPVTGSGLLAPAEAGGLHGAPGHAELPPDPHLDAAGPSRVGGRDPRRDGPRGTDGRAGVVPARSGCPGAAGDRCGRRRHQPAAGAPDGELRPAVEPEPAGAAVRPHPSHRPDGGVPPVEPGGRRDARGRRLLPAAGEARERPEGARRAGVRRPGQAPVRREAAAGPADRGDPLRRPTRGARDG